MKTTPKFSAKGALKAKLLSMMKSGALSVKSKKEKGNG